LSSQRKSQQLLFSHLPNIATTQAKNNSGTGKGNGTGQARQAPDTHHHVIECRLVRRRFLDTVVNHDVPVREIQTAEPTTATWDQNKRIGGSDACSSGGCHQKEEDEAREHLYYMLGNLPNLSHGQADKPVVIAYFVWPQYRLVLLFSPAVLANLQRNKFSNHSRQHIAALILSTRSKAASQTQNSPSIPLKGEGELGLT
jgi:hypothetical protein